MFLSVSKALEHPGEAIAFTASVQPEDQTFGGEEIRFPKPAVLSGTMTAINESIVLQGTIQAAISANCVRCLEETTFTLEVPFEDTFVREPIAENEEALLYESSRVELDSVVLTNVFINLPIQILCSKNCKGLCPKCGQNLNKAQCLCGANRENSPFAVLKALQFTDEDGE